MFWTASLCWCYRGVSAVIDSALFEDNTASDSGGAISQDSANTSLQASVFMGNKAQVARCL